MASFRGRHASRARKVQSRRFSPLSAEFRSSRYRGWHSSKRGRSGILRRLLLGQQLSYCSLPPTRAVGDLVDEEFFSVALSIYGVSLLGVRRKSESKSYQYKTRYEKFIPFFARGAHAVAVRKTRRQFASVVAVVRSLGAG